MEAEVEFPTKSGHQVKGYPLAALERDKQEALLAKLFLKDLVFGAQVVDDGLLAVVDPASKDSADELPGVQDEVHTPIRGAREGNRQDPCPVSTFQAGEFRCTQ
jgi:hypothetical protein